MSAQTAALSRRAFLASLGAGSLVLAARVQATPRVARLVGKAPLAFEPDLFLAIDPTGAVHILAHRSEMGTGIRTSLPLVVADELGADWDQVIIEQAIGNPELGSQNTDGSHSIRRFFDRMRVAGAAARHMLEQAAAARWSVPVEELSTHDHAVHHADSGRALGFAELVEEAAAFEVPAPDTLSFRPSSEWRYIGKDLPITDLDAILTGKATFGLDARMEGQVFAVIARSPVLGGKVKSIDDEATRAMPGVLDVIQLPDFTPPHAFQALGGVAVVATDTWSALRGRERLEIEWEDSPHSGFNSDEFEAVMAESARTPGKVWRDEGDVDEAFEWADTDKVYEAEYYAPLLSHAPMEPPCAVADVQMDADGNAISCEAWAPTQNPQAVQSTLAGTLGIAAEDAYVNVTLLGGGFGRKSKPDYVAEAALLSRELGKPVHVFWSREDDIRHDYYHTAGAMFLQAVHDEGGMPTAMKLRSAFPTISSTFAPGAREGSAGEVGMGLMDLPYAIENLRVENGPADAHVRIGWLRSVAHIYHAFAVCSFPDELAHRAGRDPYEFLMELLGEDRHLDLSKVQYGNGGESYDRFPIDIGRLRHVTRRAAELAGWGKELPKGRGLGIACHRSFMSYCANVVEVEVAKDGTLRIPRVHVVIDAGLVVSPDRVRAQMEGAATFATSLTLHGEITAKDGKIVQSNFHDYKIARMDESPTEIVVEIVETDAPPGGVGEVGVPPFAPAVCNAIQAATGQRIRRLPLARHDLSWS